MMARWRVAGLVVGLVAVGVLLFAWVLHASIVNHWLAVHTGTVNEAGPYYGFWSGFGSDLAEFGLIGVVSTGVYHIVKKYNCHEPGCWRVGVHPAAGGQFLLCYRHHPDFQGKRPTHDLIQKLHQDHLANEAAIHSELAKLHGLVASPGPSSGDPIVEQ